MSILNSDLKWYGSATMPDDDTVTAIGGAVATSKKVEFFDVTGTVQYVSSAAGDTTQTVTTSYIPSTGGVVTTEVKTLNGTTPVLGSANMLEILKAIKSASTTGDVAVENQTAFRTGTAQGGGPEVITLDAGASGLSATSIQGMVIRITGGTGAGQIREIIQFTPATQVAEVSYAWGTQPDNTSVFRISQGIVFEKSPFEILECRRPFFNAAADVPGGVTKNYYDKIFFRNAHGSISLTAAQIIEQVNPLTDISFGLPATIDDTGTNGGGNNRQVAPAGITFVTTSFPIPFGGILSASSSMGVWMKRTLLAGAQASNIASVMRGTGNTT